MKKRTQHLIAEAPRKRGQVELTIGIVLLSFFERFIAQAASKYKLI